MIDSHCHLDLIPAEITTTLNNAQINGVRSVVVPGTHPSQWPKIELIAKQNPSVFFAAGLHPWWIKKTSNNSDNAAQLSSNNFEAFVSNPKCIAIGECGLDKTITIDLTEQSKILEQQIGLACEFKLPLIIHSVKTHNEVIRVLKNTKPKYGGVIHAFSGSFEEAKTFWELGFYLGVGGTITYPRAQKTRSAVKAMPLESLLLETDAPDMPINGKQGQPNSPEYLPEIAHCLAKLRGEDFDTIDKQTSENTLRLFGKMSEV